MKNFFKKNKFFLIAILTLGLVLILMTSSVFLKTMNYFSAYLADLIFQQQPEPISDKEVKLEIQLDNLVQDLEIDRKSKYRIILKNQGSLEINNLKLRLSTDNPNFSIKDNQEISLAKQLQLNQFQEKDLEVIFTSQSKLANQQISLQAEIEYEAEDQVYLQQLSWPSLRVWGQVEVKSAAAYYSSQGDQLGIGPLPPKVGIPTNYWIFWELNDFSNPINDFNLVAELSPEVTFTGKKTVLVGQLNYDKETQQISWQIDQPQKGARARVGFEVSIRPQSQDVGQLINLIEKINYSVFDAFVAKNTSQSLPDINTQLNQDQLARNKGRVVE